MKASSIIKTGLIMAGTGIAGWGIFKWIKQIQNKAQDSSGSTSGDPKGTKAKTTEEFFQRSKYFKRSEFDSADLPGSGVKMKLEFLEILEEARRRTGIPFIINSGYRTKQHNANEGGVPDSAHTKGYAADIKYKTEADAIRIVRNLRDLGVKRFGIYSTFIHADIDPTKPSPIVWRGNGAPTFDPFTV